MRSLVLLALVAACGYPKPPDRCEGTCSLLSIDRQLVNAGDEIWFEGTFEEGAQIQFPGVDYLQSLDVAGDHRGATTVPMSTTAGDVIIKTTAGDTWPVPIRRASFKMTMQPFMMVNEQGDYARTNVLPRVHVGGAAIVIGQQVYLIGGLVDNSQTNDVETALWGLDGGLDTPRMAGQLQIPRAYHTVTRAGRYVFVIGGTGNGAGQSVERAMIDDNGRLTPFEPTNVQLNESRSGHAAAVIGNSLYVFGGRNGTTPLGSIERARLSPDGQIGDFEIISEVSLKTPRSSFTVAYTGNQLYAIGGLGASAPTDSVERMEIYPDGYVADFETAGHLVEARSGHVSVVIGNNVFVIGGKAMARTLTSVEYAPIVMTQSLEFSAMLDQVKLNEPKHDAALAVVGNYVYVLGGARVGTGTDGDSEIVERASIVDVGGLSSFATNAVTLSMARTQAASVVIGNKLYVIGGLDGTTAQQSIDASSINPDGTLGGFGTIGMLKKPRYGHSVIVDNNKVWVLGGKDSQHSIIPDIEFAVIDEQGNLGMFNSASVALPRGRAYFNVYADGIFAYIIGGHDMATGVPTTGIDLLTFVNGSPTGTINTRTLQDARDDAAMVVLGPWVYVMGGFDPAATPSPGLYRDTVRAPHRTDSSGLASDFTTATPTPKPREGHRAFLLGNTLYVVGGVNGTAAQPTETTKVAPDGTYLPFTTDAALAPETLRQGFTTVVLGNYVYLIGGKSIGGPALMSLEAAQIK